MSSSTRFRIALYLVLMGLLGVQALLNVIPSGVLDDGVFLRKAVRLTRSGLHLLDQAQRTWPPNDALLSMARKCLLRAEGLAVRDSMDHQRAFALGEVYEASNDFRQAMHWYELALQRGWAGDRGELYARLLHCHEELEPIEVPELETSRDDVWLDEDDWESRSTLLDDEIGDWYFEGVDGTGEELQTIIRTLAEVLGLRLEFRGEVQGKVVLITRERRAWDVLEFVLASQGLPFELDGETLIVYGEETSTPPDRPFRDRSLSASDLLQSILDRAGQAPLTEAEADAFEEAIARLLRGEPLPTFADLERSPFCVLDPLDERRETEWSIEDVLSRSGERRLSSGEATRYERELGDFLIEEELPPVEADSWPVPSAGPESLPQF